MSQEVEKEAPARPAPAPPVEPRRRALSRGTELLRWLGALIAGLVVFGAFVLANGADPFAVYADIWTSTLTQPGQFQQIVLRAAPIALAGLAVVVPARAGLVNVGGEGQLIIGAVAAAGVALWLTPVASPWLVMLLMVLAATVAGAAWAGIAAATAAVSSTGAVLVPLVSCVMPHLRA